MGNRLGPWRGHVALLLLLIAPSAVLAHHGFGGRYDRAAPIYLEGFVETAHFGYPHAELTLRIDPEASRLYVAATLPVASCTEDELRELARAAHHIECESDASTRRVVASFDYELLRQ